MALEQHIVRSVVRQFGHPRGPLGRLVGWSMGRRASNVERSRWAVELLDLQSGDRLLEIGCGPGVAIQAAAAHGATVVGVDRSAVMVGQARRRNRRAVRTGQVEVCLAPVEALPTFEAPFDKALAVNTLGHWDDPVAGLTAIRHALKPDATLAVVSQPRAGRPGTTGAARAQGAAAELRRLLAEAGFGPARLETLDLDPPVACLLAQATNLAKHA